MLWVNFSTRCRLYNKLQLAIVRAGNRTAMDEFLAAEGDDDHSLLRVGNGAEVKATRANLISQLPKWADDETHKPGR